MKRKLIIALALCLALALGIGGTMAYLTATTTEVKNTFTIGKVDLELFETKLNSEGKSEKTQARTYKIVPGQTVDKDPTITVTKDSEACWLFVKVTEDLGSLNNVFKPAEDGKFFAYDLATGWTKLDSAEGDVYYRTVPYATDDITIQVLKENKVTLSDKITQPMSDALKVENAKAPTLTFTAAAVQHDGVDTVELAYAEIRGNL